MKQLQFQNLGFLFGALLLLMGFLLLVVRLEDQGYLVPLAVVILPLGLTVAIKYPGALFAAYLYIPFYKNIVDDYVPIDITLVLATACIGVAVISSRSWLNSRSLTLLLPWTLLLGMVALGVTYAVDPVSSVQVFLEFLGLVYLPLILAIPIVRDARYIRQFLIVTVAVSIGITIFGTFSLVTSSFGIGCSLQRVIRSGYRERPCCFPSSLLLPGLIFVRLFVLCR
jgi:hypothetical protein